jgi:hypothetical protein
MYDFHFPPRTISFFLLLAMLSPAIFAGDRPEWLLSPEREGYISVVGFAPRQASGGSEAQRRVALLKAHQQLGQIVRVRIENTQPQETQVKNGKVTQSAESFTRASSHAKMNLSDAEVTAQWVDQNNGDLYILFELPNAW